MNTLLTQTALPVGSESCTNGGIRVDSGLDSNNSGTLEAAEITESNNLCSPSSTTVLDPALVAAGKEIFRYDTFNDEVFWTDTLQMHTVIESALDPLTALQLGFKVDSDVLPQSVIDLIESGDPALEDPATTLALISLNAVIGVQGTVENIDGQNRLTSVGITCALCHSDVDNSIAPGIGKRLDGWPNRDINPGMVLSLSPALQDSATQAVLTSWGPGKYDAYWNLDGINDPAVIPPAYGLNGVHLETYTGEGEVSYWNAYVAITQMGGVGNFRDDELGINIEVPEEEDAVTGKLRPLKEYQLSLLAPTPPEGSYDPVAAGRGKAVFEGAGNCASCHTGSLFTDANIRLHDPEEVGTDDVLAMRGTTGQYRTTPLKGIWHRSPYFHDGSAATLTEVINHYDTYMSLGLTDGQKNDLEEYLRSL